MATPLEPYRYTRRGEHPTNLIGMREQRVFVGGHYDFMPVLQLIADYVAQVNSPDGSPFIPIIPYFHSIRLHEVMEEDRRIVRNCGKAIFEASDLGGQLIEMEQTLTSRIPTLVVYPVREGSQLDPERGRLTLTTCGHPFTSYVTYDELMEKVRVFLLELEETRGQVTRHQASPDVEEQVQQIHRLIRDQLHGQAKQAVQEFIRNSPADGVVDARLALALIETRDGNFPAVEPELEAAEAACHSDSDRAEVAYYRALIESEPVHRNWTAAIEQVSLANDLLPDNPRILVLLGFSHYLLGRDHWETAIQITKKALEIIPNQLTQTGIQEVNAALTKAQAENNLAYYYCELARTEADQERLKELASDALRFSENLPLYHRMLRRRSGAFLDTRGCALLLNGKLDRNLGLVEQAITILGHARSTKETEAATNHWREALILRQELGG